MNSFKKCILFVIVLAVFLSGCSFSGSKEASVSSSPVAESTKEPAPSVPEETAEPRQESAEAVSAPAAPVPSSAPAAEIGKEAALSIALKDAGLTEDQITDLDIDYEKTPSSAWYEIDFDYQNAEYEYDIDAFSGEILSKNLD